MYVRHLQDPDELLHSEWCVLVWMSVVRQQVNCNHYNECGDVGVYLRWQIYVRVLPNGHTRTKEWMYDVCIWECVCGYMITYTWTNSWLNNSCSCCSCCWIYLDIWDPYGLYHAIKNRNDHKTSVTGTLCCPICAASDGPEDRWEN